MIGFFFYNFTLNKSAKTEEKIDSRFGIEIARTIADHELLAKFFFRLQRLPNLQLSAISNLRIIAFHRSIRAIHVKKKIHRFYPFVPAKIGKRTDRLRIT